MPPSANSALMPAGETGAAQTLDKSKRKIVNKIMKRIAIINKTKAVYIHWFFQFKSDIFDFVNLIKIYKQAIQMDERVKKALKKYWFLWLIVILMAANLQVVQRNSPILLGMGASMLPTMSFANLVFVDKQTSFEELKETDIIAFLFNLPKNSIEDKPITILAIHRIFSIWQEDGMVVTVGDANWKEYQSIIETHVGERHSEIIKTEESTINAPTQMENVKKNQFIGKIYFWIPLEPLIILALILLFIKKIKQKQRK